MRPAGPCSKYSCEVSSRDEDGALVMLNIKRFAEANHHVSLHSLTFVAMLFTGPEYWIVLGFAIVLLMILNSLYARN